jgi:Zn-dependent protease with chaperone function
MRRDVEARSRFLHVARRVGYANTGRILAWSLAAAASIVLVVLYGIPFVAERLTPLIPFSFEKRVGEMADNQVRAIFDEKVCTSDAGRAAFAKLVESIRQAGQLEIPLQAEVIGSTEQNAFALPGGRVYLLNGLLQKAENPDELAGVLAHELGHVQHRDHMRMMIETGGTSFLIGLLFGDVTGSGVVIFASRTLIEASHSRAAERHADDYATQVMHRLGRSPKPMGDLLFRITGAQGNKTIGILASHPLTEDRREMLRRQDRPNSGPELLSAGEWQALKAICR